MHNVRAVILSGLVGLWPGPKGQLTVNPLIPAAVLPWWYVSKPHLARVSHYVLLPVPSVTRHDDKPCNVLCRILSHRRCELLWSTFSVGIDFAVFLNVSGERMGSRCTET